MKGQHGAQARRHRGRATRFPAFAGQSAQRGRGTTRESASRTVNSKPGSSAAVCAQAREKASSNACRSSGAKRHRHQRRRRPVSGLQIACGRTPYPRPPETSVALKASDAQAASGVFVSPAWSTLSVDGGAIARAKAASERGRAARSSICPSRTCHNSKSSCQCQRMSPSGPAGIERLIAGAGKFRRAVILQAPGGRWSTSNTQALICHWPFSTHFVAFYYSIRRNFSLNQVFSGDILMVYASKIPEGFGMVHLLLAVIYLAFISLGLPDSLLGSAWPSMHLRIRRACFLGGRHFHDHRRWARLYPVCRATA